MIRIKKIAAIQEGKNYLMINHQFNSAENRIICISKDYTGLNRNIAYFVYQDRQLKIPTKKEFINAIKKNKNLGVFALWQHEIETNTEILTA